MTSYMYCIAIMIQVKYSISECVTEIMIFTVETHDKYLFQTKKIIYSCTVATAGRRLLKWQPWFSTQTHWTLDFTYQMAEQRLAVCRSNSIQKCGQAHFVLGGARGLQVVCRAVSLGGPHKWNITSDITAILDHVDLSIWHWAFSCFLGTRG